MDTSVLKSFMATLLKSIKKVNIKTPVEKFEIELKQK